MANAVSVTILGTGTSGNQQPSVTTGGVASALATSCLNTVVLDTSSFLGTSAASAIVITKNGFDETIYCVESVATIVTAANVTFKTLFPVTVLQRGNIPVASIVTQLNTEKVTKIYPTNDPTAIQAGALTRVEYIQDARQITFDVLESVSTIVTSMG